MRTLFLTLGLSLMAGLQAQDPSASGEEARDVSGKWYLKAVTDQEIPWLDLQSVPPITLTVLEEGNLEAKTTTFINGECREVILVLEKTKEPDTYISQSGKVVLHFTKLRMGDHYVLYAKDDIKSSQIRMASLFGRNSEDKQEVLEYFKDVVEAVGFNRERIITPKQCEPCLPGKD